MIIRTGKTGLEPLIDVGEMRLHGLRHSLAEAAEREDLLDVSYREIDTPLGPVLIAASPRGLLRVAYEREGIDSVLEALATKYSPRILRSPRGLDEAARQIDEYFEGHREAFTLPLDFGLSKGFRKIVLDHLPAIPYGRTESYRDVADAVGNPKAVRAVGTACATNPLPIVVPCHRVLRTDGRLGGYIGGLEAKTTLLELEARTASRASVNA